MDSELMSRTSMLSRSTDGFWPRDPDNYALRCSDTRNYLSHGVCASSSSLLSGLRGAQITRRLREARDCRKVRSTSQFLARSLVQIVSCAHEPGARLAWRYTSRAATRPNGQGLR